MRIEKIICDLCDQESSDCRTMKVGSSLTKRCFDVCPKCHKRVVDAVEVLTQETVIIEDMNLGENIGLGIRLEKGISLEALNLLLGKHCLGTPPQIKL